MRHGVEGLTAILELVRLIVQDQVILSYIGEQLMSELGENDLTVMCYTLIDLPLIDQAKCFRIGRRGMGFHLAIQM